MNIAPITVNNQAFKGRNNDGTGGGGKALASAVVPGLGQFFDGRNDKGFAFLGGMIGLNALSMYVNKDMYKPLFDGNMEKYLKVLPKVYEKKGQFGKNALIGFALMGLWLANIVDAYRGSKNDARRFENID